MNNPRATDEQKKEAGKLRPKMHECLGEALNGFNILEDFLRTSIGSLLNLRDPFALDALLGRMSFRQLVDSFQTLCAQRTAGDFNLSNRLDKLVNALDKRVAERNDLVHSVWGIEFVNYERTGVFKSRYKQSKNWGRVSSESESIPFEKFDDLIKNIEETCSDLDGLVASTLERLKTGGAVR